jgi:hypothetical protein
MRPVIADVLTWARALRGHVVEFESEGCGVNAKPEFGRVTCGLTLEVL